MNTAAFLSSPKISGPEVLPDPDISYWKEFCEQCQEWGMEPAFHSFDDNEDLAELLQQLREEGTERLVFFPDSAQAYDHQLSVDLSDFYVVLIGSNIAVPALHCIAADAFNVEVFFEKMNAKGYEHWAYVTLDTEVQGSVFSYFPFSGAAREVERLELLLEGLSDEEAVEEITEFCEEGGYEALVFSRDVELKPLLAKLQESLPEVGFACASLNCYSNQEFCGLGLSLHEMVSEMFMLLNVLVSEEKKGPGSPAKTSIMPRVWHEGRHLPDRQDLLG